MSSRIHIRSAFPPALLDAVFDAGYMTVADD
jgi:hypothetical protein